MVPYKAITAYLQARESRMFDLLEELVLIQSGSYHKKGVDRVGRRLAQILAESHMAPQVIEQSMLGDHVIARSPAVSDFDTQILMVGHMDTVFPADTEFNWYKEDDAKSYGPGVVDMKGGLVTGIFALQALGQLGLLDKIPVTFFLNSDEEIGSRSSLEYIQKEAEQSAFAFVLEAGGHDNKIVTGRKGNLTIEIQIMGQAGHAAFATKDKASSILEMAHKTIQFEGLNDFGRGITVNVGKVEGGIGPNTVPELSHALIDFRFLAPEDLSYLEERVSEIAGTQLVPGTECRAEFLTGRPPMQQSRGNRKLFRHFETVASILGEPVEEEFRFGVSDANFIADLKVPVLDGLGPIGLKDHSRDEYMLKKSLLQRAILLACGLLECWDVRETI